MRTPKAPLGFIPVDSEEAKGIDDDCRVNLCYIRNGAWGHGPRCSMAVVRAWHEQDGNILHYHVQLPPPVEWDEVWAVKSLGYLYSSSPLYAITKNGESVLQPAPFTYDELNTIVAALNKMEEGNG